MIIGGWVSHSLPPDTMATKYGTFYVEVEGNGTSSGHRPGDGNPSDAVYAPVPDSDEGKSVEEQKTLVC